MPTRKYFLRDGDQFGLWIVIKAQSGKSLVRCRCGFEKFVKNSTLVKKQSKSCGKKGCFTGYIDLTNLTFGFLTAISMTDKRYPEGQIVWKCKCVCDKIIEVSCKFLMAGSVKSCGCMTSQLQRKQNKNLLPPEERAIRTLFRNYIYGAKARKISFDLEIEKFSSLVKLNCHYCGCLPSKILKISRFNDPIFEFYWNGIDRIDSSLGYTINNCVTCCSTCNYIKGKKSYYEFMKWIKNLIFYQYNKLFVIDKPG